MPNDLCTVSRNSSARKLIFHIGKKVNVKKFFISLGKLAEIGVLSKQESSVFYQKRNSSKQVRRKTSAAFWALSYCRREINDIGLSQLYV